MTEIKTFRTIGSIQKGVKLYCGIFDKLNTTNFITQSEGERRERQRQRDKKKEEEE